MARDPEGPTPGVSHPEGKGLAITADGAMPHPVLVEVQFSVNNSESNLHPPIRQDGCCLLQGFLLLRTENHGPDTMVSLAAPRSRAGPHHRKLTGTPF